MFALLARMFGDRVLDTEAPGTWQNPYASPGEAGDAAAAIASAGGAFYVLGVLTGLARRRRPAAALTAARSASRSSGSRSRRAVLAASWSPRQPARLGLRHVGESAGRRSSCSDRLGLPIAIGHRDPALPPLRHRRRHQPHAGLRRAHGDARRRRTSVVLVLLVLLTLPATPNLAIAGLDARGRRAVPPGRSRIQEAVDHRFYRRRYDAERTLETFSARLREEVDIHALQRELVARGGGDGAARARRRCGCGGTR